MKKHSSTLKKISEGLKAIDNNTGYTIAILIVLVFASVLLVGYFVLIRPTPEGYMSIYVLDAQKKAEDYPELLVINQNNTFNVWVGVENHMGNVDKLQAQVFVKITNSSISSYPAYIDANVTYSLAMENKGKWENQTNITIDEPGNYAVIFELWAYDNNLEAMQFTGNFVRLNIAVLDDVSAS